MRSLLQNDAIYILLPIIYLLSTKSLYYKKLAVYTYNIP